MWVCLMVLVWVLLSVVLGWLIDKFGLLIWLVFLVISVLRIILDLEIFLNCIDMLLVV